MVLLIALIALYIELKYIKEDLDFSFKKELFLGILVRKHYYNKTNIWNSFISSIYWV